MAEAEGEKRKSGAERRRERALQGAAKAKTDEKQADPEVLAGIKHLISRKGVDWVEGVWTDQHGRPTTRMDFCQGSNMIEKLMESRLAKEGDKYYCIENREDAANLCERIMSADCFFRVDCREWNGRIHLSRSRRQVFEDDENAAYIITYEGSHLFRYLIGGAILLIGLAMVMFPVWPDAAKYAVRDLSRYLLTAMLGMLVPLTVLRPIVAGVTGWWLLPNLWIEEEFFASFKPLWQPPMKNRDAGSDALITVIVTVIVFTTLYYMVNTEVVDPDADAPEIDAEALFDDLLDKEDVYDPEAAAAAEAAAAEASMAAAAEAADGSEEPPPPPADKKYVDPSWGEAEQIEMWDDEDEDVGADLMDEFLQEKQEEQRKLDKKNPYREDKKRKPIHGGS